MKPTFKSCLGLMAAMAIASAASAQPVIDLSMSSGSIEGNPGETKSVTLTASLATSGDLEAGDERAGAQGWSISLRSDLAITDIATEGTDAADLFAGGFEATQLGSDDGHAGACEGAAPGTTAVSAIVLSFTMPVTTPADGSATIANVTVECTIGDEDSSHSVDFVDGCRGAGQPVNNAGTHNGSTVTPNTSGGTVDCVVVITCVNAPLNVATRTFGGEEEGDADTVAALLATIDDPASAEVETRVGDETSADVFGHIISNGLDSGVQGWSLAVGVVGGDVTEVTTAGTVGLAKQAGGFEQTQEVDPDVEQDSGPLAGLGPQGEGGVSAVVLSFTMPVTLEPTGSAAVLKVSLTAGPQGEDPIAVGVEWKDGLKGAGQPVSNVATVSGATEAFCTCQALSISFIPRTDPEFVRGDANNDAKTDIADAVFIVNELFRGGEPTDCKDASDANDDGLNDLTDAVFIVEYQFVGGSAPAAPFPGCGIDESEDELGCDRVSCP